MTISQNLVSHIWLIVPFEETKYIQCIGSWWASTILSSGRAMLAQITSTTSAHPNALSE